MAVTQKGFPQRGEISAKKGLGGSIPRKPNVRAPPAWSRVEQDLGVMIATGQIVDSQNPARPRPTRPLEFSVAAIVIDQQQVAALREPGGKRRRLLLGRARKLDRIGLATG
jgi:hypothetical protein